MVDGGIYDGPGGEKLYGSGRQVESLGDLEARARARKLVVFLCSNCHAVTVGLHGMFCRPCKAFIEHCGERLGKNVNDPKNIIEYVVSLEGKLRAYEQHDRKLFWGGFAWGTIATALLTMVLWVLAGYRTL